MTDTLRHRRSAGWILRLVALVGLTFPAAALVDLPIARAEGLLVSRDEAARHGLERAWFAQAAVDPSRSRVTSWLLDFDRLYAITDAGVLTALDAETGATLWTKQIGDAGRAAFGPAANAERLAVVSVDKLLLLERESGRLLWTRKLGSAPAAGPALSREYVFVALLNGRIEGYRIDDPERQPWYYQSDGRIFQRPTTTGAVVSWPTSTGKLYVSDADNPKVRFRLATGRDIVTSPAEADPYLLIASLDGYVYCINEQTGRESWRFSVGYPISSSPAIVGQRAFVASLEPAVFALDLPTGRLLWSVPGVSHIAAIGKDRAYATDRYGNLLTLDLQTGAVLSRLKTAPGTKSLVNDQTDRIVLVSDRGLVQTLREIDAEKPTLYRTPFEQEMASRAAEAAKKTADDASPFTDEPPPEDGPDDAAPDDAEEGFDEPTDEQNPFEAEDAAAEADRDRVPPEYEPVEDDNPFE